MKKHTTPTRKDDALTYRGMVIRIHRMFKSSAPSVFDKFWKELRDVRHRLGAATVVSINKSVPWPKIRKKLLQ